MKQHIGCLALLALAAMVVAAPATAADDRIAASIREGARIDNDCLKKNILKEVGACRVAATGAQRDPAIMLGLYFHMWFSDAVLAEVYRSQKPEVADVFVRLADAEFPAVVAYEDSLKVTSAEVCALLQLNCATTARYDAAWRTRLKK
jgi:hypothetical protein